MLNYRLSMRWVAPLICVASILATGAGASEKKGAAPAAAVEAGGWRLGIGWVSPTVLGENYLQYERKGGFNLEGLTSYDWLGDSLDFHAAVEVQPYDVKGLAAAKFTQWNLFVGVETRQPNTGFIRPLVGLDVGTQYNYLTFDSGTDNAKTALAARLRTGFAIPLFSSVQLVYSMPVTVGFSQSKFVSLGNMISVRFAL